MLESPAHATIAELVLAAIKRFVKPGAAPSPHEIDPDPDEPFACVGAPKKPRLPHLSAGAAAPLDFT